MALEGPALAEVGKGRVPELDVFGELHRKRRGPAWRVSRRLRDTFVCRRGPVLRYIVEIVAGDVRHDADAADAEALARAAKAGKEAAAGQRAALPLEQARASAAPQPTAERSDAFLFAATHAPQATGLVFSLAA